MRGSRVLCLLVISGGLCSAAAAQATGLPSFNAPYRAFQRSEIGLVLTFPDGGGTAFEGAYRFASGKFDLGFRGGIFDPGGAGSGHQDRELERDRNERWPAIQGTAADIQRKVDHGREPLHEKAADSAHDP